MPPWLFKAWFSGSFLLILLVVGSFFGVVKKYLRPGLRPAFAEVTGRELIDWQAVAGKRCFVALTFGQSNSSNYCALLSRSQGAVYSFFEGKLYRAEDPQLGADGELGTPWPLLGDRLLEATEYEAVIFMSIGYGGSEVAEWVPGGRLHKRLLSALRDVEDAGLAFTHLLWHQGESDNQKETTEQVYTERFLAMLSAIRAMGVEAPVFVSEASFDPRMGVSEAVQSAQRRLVNAEPTIFAGPNTDVFPVGARYDGYHFSKETTLEVVELWLDALRPWLKSEGLLTEN